MIMEDMNMKIAVFGIRAIVVTTFLYYFYEFIGWLGRIVLQLQVSAFQNGSASYGFWHKIFTMFFD
jgi:hypothetical protein